MNSITRDESRFSDDEIVEMARSVEPHDFDRIDPPPQVWNNVLAELEVAMATEERSARRRAQHQWFSPARLLSAAAVALLMVGVTVAVVTSRDSDDAPIEIAAALMTDETLDIATDATAQASVVCADDGTNCVVKVDLTSLDLGAEENDADLELWVINSDVSDMHSLGLVTANSGDFELPAGVTADDFPIVDISIEPRDGVETHSGLSVLRGVLEQA